MPSKRTLELSTEQLSELTEMRDHSPKPYLRERAAALLKIHSGKSASWVAAEGLLREYQPDTICDWLNRYEEKGIDGLLIQEGRGRKAAYDP